MLIWNPWHGCHKISEDAVYHYNHGMEADFYIPENETAIQVSYSIAGPDETFDRETKALLKYERDLLCGVELS